MTEPRSAHGRTVLVSYPLRYNGQESLRLSFGNIGAGVVLEEDDHVGYLYATNERFDQILDAMMLYSVHDDIRLKPGDTVLIVWNDSLQKTGIHFHNRFQAIVDFKNQLACCRTGFPVKTGDWCKSSHLWDNQLLSGLQ